MTTPELEELLREDAPRPSPEFALEMEERLAAGFPRRRRAAGGARGRSALFTRLPRPVIAGLASAGLALAVAGALLAGGGERAADRTAIAPGDSLATPERAAPEVAPAVPRPGEEIAPGQRDRQVERSAQLELAAPADEVGDVADGIAAVADRHRGFVLRSEVRSREDGSGGLFELRIPEERLRPALADLAALGEVRSRAEQGQDVTAALGAVAERLEEARAERRSLLRRLERASTDRESEAIRRRLRLVSAEIRGLTRELRARRERVAYAAVTVTLRADGDGDSDDGGIGAAIDDAGRTLEAALALAIRIAAVLAPLALLAAALALLLRALRRRRRDAALG